MNRKTFINLLISVLAIMLVSGCSEKRERQAHERGVIDNSQSPYTRLRSIPMQDTQLTEDFREKRFELAANKMLPTLEKIMSGDGTANLNRIKYTAGLIQGNNHGTPWGDGDNYKWIESMAKN